MASTSSIEYVRFGPEDDLDCNGCIHIHRAQRIKMVDNKAFKRTVELLVEERLRLRRARIISDCTDRLSNLWDMYNNENRQLALRNDRLFRAYAVSMSRNILCGPCIDAICNSCVAAMLDFDKDTYEPIENQQHKIFNHCITQMFVDCHLKNFEKVMFSG